MIEELSKKLSKIFPELDNKFIGEFMASFFRQMMLTARRRNIFEVKGFGKFLIKSRGKGKKYVVFVASEEFKSLIND
jgi:nucleoid DNA-binding protein